MNKQFIAIVSVIIIGLVGMFFFTREGKDGTSGNVGQPSNHSVGAGKKGVTLIEYGDLQCPACKSYYPMVKQLKEKFGDDITFSFRHFPLTQIHSHAYEAARAAEAAGKQGKFFEMHDLMYENQDDWTSLPSVSSTFANYATQLGLNIDQFKADMASEQAAGTINADTKAAVDIGATSTPTFVINGKKLDQNPRSLEEFIKLIEDAIQNATNS